MMPHPGGCHASHMTVRSSPFPAACSQATCDANGKVLKSTTGKFVTAPKPTDAADVTFAWVADIAGQGWGINKDITLKLASEQPFNGNVVPVSGRAWCMNHM